MGEEGGVFRREEENVEHLTSDNPEKSHGRKRRVVTKRGGRLRRRGKKGRGTPAGKREEGRGRALLSRRRRVHR